MLTTFNSLIIFISDCNCIIIIKDVVTAPLFFAFGNLWWLIFHFYHFSGGNGYFGSPSNIAATGVKTQGNNGGTAYDSGWPFLGGGGGGAAGAGIAGTSS